MYVGCVNGNPRRFTDALQMDYMSEVAACFTDIEALFAEAKLDTYTVDNLEEEIFEEAKKDKKAAAMPKEEPKPTQVSESFAAKLGRKIKELVRKIKEAIMRFTDAIRGRDREYEKVQAEIEKCMKEDPSLKDLVLTATSEGLMDWRDIRSITEFREAVEKISAEKNPKTLKQKFEALKKKWDDPEHTKTKSRIAFVTAAIGLGAALYKFMPDLKNAAKVLKDASKRDQEELNKFAEVINKGVEEGVYKNMEDMNIIQLNIALRKYSQGNIAEMERALLKDYDKMNGILKKVVNTVSKTPGNVKKKKNFMYADLGVKIDKNKEKLDQAIKDFDPAKKSFDDRLSPLRKANELYKKMKNTPGVDPAELDKQRERVQNLNVVLKNNYKYNYKPKSDQKKELEKHAKDLRNAQLDLVRKK